MKEILIRQYIERMTLNDVENFALSNGIILKEMEIELLFDYIRKDWRTIIYGNPRYILDDLKEHLDPFSYKKIEELYIHFKNKYL